MEQFFRQMTPDTGPFDLNIISNAMSALFQKIGDGILFTHSQGSSPGWHTRMRNSNVKSIIAFEPGNGFPFLPEDAPQPMPSSSPYGTLYPEIISFEEFETLTSIPLLIIYGDNIPDEPTNVWSQDNWRVRLDMARLWVEAINKHGGNAKLLHLPDITLIGNGHFACTEMNTLQIANLVLNFIEEHV